MDIDAPGADGLFNLRQLTPVGYTGVAGDGSLRLHGFDAEAIDDDTLRFFLINHRTPTNDAGERIDATKVGANSTVEVFEVKRGSNDMTHIQTVADPAIQTPNKIAATGDGGFVLTNDRSGKVGFRRHLDVFLGSGSLAYCDATSTCAISSENGFSFPNGIVRGHDGLFYVPNSFATNLTVLQLHTTNSSLTEVATIRVGLSVDNGAVDRDGDIYLAGFPTPLKMLQSAKDPWNAHPPTTVIRLRKEGEEYKAEKVLEDGEGKVLAGATVARHDAKTGRIFLGGECLVDGNIRLLTSIRGVCSLFHGVRQGVIILGWHAKHCERRHNMGFAVDVQRAIVCVIWTKQCLPAPGSSCWVEMSRKSQICDRCSINFGFIQTIEPSGVPVIRKDQSIFNRASPY